jgi:hypothetical protein
MMEVYFIMNNSWNRFVKYLVDVLFVIGIITEAAMPLLLWHLVKTGVLVMPGSMQNTPAGGSISITGVLELLLPVMAAGVFALMIFWHLRRMMSTVLKGDCFVHENVKSLHRMGIYAMVIVGFIVLRCFLFFTLTLMVVALVFLIAGSFCFVLERVFDQAVSYKEENDLTI